MRIVYVVHRYYPNVGGVEGQVRSLARSLSKRHDVIVVTFDSPVLRTELIDGIRVIRYPCVQIPLFDTRFLINWAWQKDLQRLRPDIIHTHPYGMWHTETAVRFAHRYEVPVLLTPFWDRAQTKSGVRKLARSVYDKTFGTSCVHLCNILVAQTEHERKFLISHFGLPPEKVVVIPCGVDVPPLPSRDETRMIRQRLGFSERTPIVLTVGRLTQKKNIETMIRALKFVKTEIPHVRLIVAGPDEGSGHALVKLARSLNLENSVVFTGEIRRDVLLDLYKICDAFALSSRGESLGIALLEAMAFRRPVVASDLPALRGVLSHGADGYLFATENHRELASYLMRLLKDRDSSRQLGMQGRLKVLKEFSSETVSGQVESLYADIAG